MKNTLSYEKQPPPLSLLLYYHFVSVFVADVVDVGGGFVFDEFFIRIIATIGLYEKGVGIFY